MSRIAAENVRCDWIDRLVPDSCARRILAEVIVTLPIPWRSDRSGDESSTAVGAHVAKNAIHARRAERAFIRADASVDGFRRQRCIAVFARRSEFKHRVPRKKTQPLGARGYSERL